MSRPDRTEWHLRGADWMAEMGDCTRRKVGAIIVATNKLIVGAGYNGTRPGAKGCLEGACPRGRHYELRGGVCRCERGVHGLCACGAEWPCPDSVEPGSSYDTGPGTCISTHAELNALNTVDNKALLVGAMMYVSTEACEGCIRHCRNTTPMAGIIWRGGMVAFP